MADIPVYYVRKDSTNYALVSFEFEREGNEKIDTTPFKVSKTTAELLSVGDDVSIGYMDGTTFVPDFSGDIVGKGVNETGSFTLESYGGRLNRADHFSEIYNDVSPEAIMEDVINNQVTTLTYSSTAVSGVTISKFDIRDQTPLEVANRLVALTGWQIRTDNDKKFYFEPEGTTINETPLIIGTNGFINGVWNYTPNSIINSLTYIGGNAVFNTSQSFTATASQTEFVVDKMISGTVRVTDNGTEVLGGIDGSTSSLIYTVDKDNKKIVFETGVTAGHTIIVYYSYEVPIKIQMKNYPSIAANKTFSRKITESNVITMSDARKRAKAIVKTYGDLTKNANVIVSYNSDYLPGETVNVTDSFNNINSSLVINKTLLKYPSGQKTIEIGTPALDVFSWNQGIETRLRELESQQDNSDTSQRYRYFKENIVVKQRDGRTRVRTDSIGHSTIVGSSTNGIVGDNTNTQDGLQQVVGGAGRVQTVVSVTNPNNTMYERFNFDTYKDTVNTTADWDVATGILTVDNGEKARSLAVAKDRRYYDSATISLSSAVSTSGLLTKLSADGGSNWETVTQDVKHNFTNIGNDLRWDVDNSAGGSGWPTAWGTWGDTTGIDVPLTEIKITYSNIPASPI